MRLFDKLIGGRGVSSQGHAPRPPVSYSAALEAAVESATFVCRESDDDGPRIAVFCNALGGAFLYSRETSEQRIRKYFAELDDDAVKRAIRHLESNLRISLKPIQQAANARNSWVHGWAWTEER